MRQDGDWQQLVAALPADFDGLARAHGAFVRRRAVRCAADLLRLVFVYAVGEFSLRLVAAWATVAGVAELSDEALLWRLRRCLPWLRALVTAQLASRGVALPATDRAGRRRLRLIDGSALSGPGSTGTDWRVHLAYDPAAQHLTAIDVTDAHGGESLTRYTFAPDDLAVADRGYCRAPGIAHVLAQQADVVVRLNTGALPLYPTAAADQPLDLGAWLAAAPPAAERPVWIAVAASGDQPAQRRPLRLLARALDAAAAMTVRRRLRQQAKKHGHPPTALSLQAAGFVLVLTSLDAVDWPATDVLSLYRFRWQIELVFKRWKGLLGLDHLHTQNPTLAQVCLLARLLVALLLDDWSAALAPVGAADAPAADHPCSLWRCFAAGVAYLRHAILGPLSLTAWMAALPRLRRFLCDSPRRRPSQAQAARHFQRLAHPTTRAVA